MPSRSPSAHGPEAAASRRVESNQTGVNANLERHVRRHLASTFRHVPAPHAREAFARLTTRIGAHGGPLLLDSGCGVGQSSIHLARAFPDHLVLGIDKSAHRLARAASHAGEGGLPDNLHLERMNLVDFHLLAADAGLRLARHYILYPNPWPKAAHLARRWHGSPVFGAMLALGGRIEVRTNWRIYAEEFARALEIAGHGASRLDRHIVSHALTPFERKYDLSGQALYRLVSPPDRPEGPTQ